MQHVSDLQLKLALRPHPVWKYGISNVRRLRLGKKKRKKKEDRRRNHRAKI